MLHFFRRKKINHASAPDLYQYSIVPSPTNGAQNAVFDTKLETMPLQVFNGPSVVAGALNVFQPTQVVQLQFNTNVGLGGINAGTVYQQPLTNNVFQIDPESPVLS